MCFFLLRHTSELNDLDPNESRTSVFKGQMVMITGEVNSTN